MRALHTPQQETNSAYNPGVAYQGGQFLAQGISQAGNALTQGLQRYAQNREEAAALDMRFEGTAKPLMEKLSLYGELADETSPASALLAKSTNWHKLGTSQKKVLLADMLLLGDKTEATQRRKEDEQWKLLAEQRSQDQFAAVQKQQGIQNERNWKNDSLAALDRHQQNMRGLEADRRADAHLSLAERGYADTLGRYAAQQQESEAQRGAMGGFLRDFNQLDEGPQFNGSGMQRPMGQFEAYRRAAGANPRAFTREQMVDIGRMAVSEDRLNQPGAAASEPSIFTDPNGNQWVRHGNNPLQRSKTEAQIAAEQAARSAPRAMAPAGSVEATLNGRKVLVGPDGRIYDMPAPNPLSQFLDPSRQGGLPPTWGGRPVQSWGDDSKGNPVKLP